MIIIVGLLVVVIGFILGKLGVHLMLICGTIGVFCTKELIKFIM